MFYIMFHISALVRAISNKNIVLGIRLSLSARKGLITPLIACSLKPLT